MSLSKALDNQVKTDVGWDIIDDSDGLAIMDRLEKELGLKTLSTINNLDLVAILSKTKKGTDEKLATYHGRFKHALEQCKANNVLPYNDHQLILLYLTNLQEPNLYSSIVSLEVGDSTTWSSITGRAIAANGRSASSA